jgi:hypothetical protein
VVGDGVGAGDDPWPDGFEVADDVEGALALVLAIDGRCLFSWPGGPWPFGP